MLKLNAEGPRDGCRPGGIVVVVMELDNYTRDQTTDDN